MYVSVLFRSIGMVVLLAGMLAGLLALVRKRFFAGPGLVVLCLVLLFHVRLMLIDVIRVDGKSMQPALHDGDFIIVERVSSGLHLPALSFPYSLLAESNKLHPPYSLTLGPQNPKQGDVIVFDYAEPFKPGRLKIKRVAAIEGQHYSFRETKLFIDDQPLLNQPSQANKPLQIEPYPEEHQDQVVDLPVSVTLAGAIFQFSAMNGVGTIGVVPGGGLLVIGDNSPASRDSRVIGFIPISAVQGRMIGKFAF